MKHACETNLVQKCMFHRRSKDRRKRCIVEQAEIAIAGLYEADRIVGLYPSDPPVNHSSQGMWVINDAYWSDVLVKMYDFPVAKVNRPGMIREVTDERLKTCTRFMDSDFLHSFNYSMHTNFADSSLHGEVDTNVISNL